MKIVPDKDKVHAASMGPTWVLSAPDGPHVGPMNLAIRDIPYNAADCYGPRHQLLLQLHGRILPCDKNSWRHGKWINSHTKTTESDTLNSLAPEECQYKFRFVIFKRILVIDGWGISCEIALIWMSLDLNDEKSTLVQVMAWCRQAPSHYMSQSWPRSLSTYGVTRPQEVNVPLTRKANSFVYWWHAFAFSGMY